MGTREMFVSLAQLILPEQTPDYRSMAAVPTVDVNQREQVEQRTTANAIRILPKISLAFERTQDGNNGGEVSVKTSERVILRPHNTLDSDIVGFILNRYSVSETLENARHSYTIQPLKSIGSLPLPLTGLAGRTDREIQMEQEEIELGLQVFTNDDFNRIANLVAKCSKIED